MKKILALILALTLVASLAACGGATGNGTADTTSPSASTDASNPTTSASNKPADTAQSPSAGTDDSGDYPMFPLLSNYAEYKYEENFKVLYLVCTTAAEYFPNSFAVFQPALEKVGISMDLLGPPEYSDASLITVLESSLQSQEYDAIVLYPITPSAITPLLEDFWNTYKVPILAFAFAPETGCGHYYLGTSYYTAGTVMGNSILDYVNKNSAYFDTLSTIPVAVYMNPAGSEQYQRIRGALDVLDKDGRFSLIQEYSANGEAACLAATETLLVDHPEVEVILTQIDNDVSGAYQPIIGGVYPHSDYISLWGFDATGAITSLMKQDGVDGVVQGSTFIEYQQSADALIEILPIIVGAAKQDKLIEFTPEEIAIMGTGLANYYVTVTPENLSQYVK